MSQDPASLSRYELSNNWLFGVEGLHNFFFFFFKAVAFAVGHKQFSCLVLLLVG